MKILIRNSDTVVIYAQHNLQLDTVEASGDGWRDPNFNTTNATLVDADLPADWAGAIWTYIGGVWAINNPAQYAINQARALAAKRAAMIVTPWQIRKALNAEGLRPAVEAAITGASQTIQDGWKHVTEFKRTGPMATALASVLSKTPAEMDAIFELAASL